VKKEVAEVIKLAEAAGFTVDRYTGTGHYKLMNGGGETMIIPSTPSGKRWKRNALAEIRRAKRKGKP
jgi:predicted RNA binding protein YcfA (HicA-like mRNA interferase family)